MRRLLDTEKTRVLSPTVAELLKEGAEKGGRYVGGKWGGLYLRAPDIYFRVLEKAGDKLVRLGDVAEVRFGIKTGANDFFYLEPLSHRPVCPLCGKEHEDALTAEEEASYWTQGQAPPGDRLVAVQSEGGWWGYLEAKSLKPIIKSGDELRQESDALPRFRLFVHSGGEHSEAYLRHGEALGVPQRSSVRTRSPWWKLSPLNPPVAIVPAGVHREYVFYLNERGFLNDKRFYGLFDVEPIVVRLMDSALFKLSLEVLVRTGLGGGLADFTVYEYKQGLLPNPRLLSRPDGKSVDQLVAKALGLTEEEQRELVTALERLIEERVSRAVT